VGPYRIERLLGKGAFAWVFRARDAAGRLAALKLLPPGFAADKGLESRFRNESTVAAELRHPNIVKIDHVGREDGFTYYVMDFYPDSLASRLERDGVLPEKQLVRTASGIAAALAFAHERGIIHRDIKIQNILYTDEGTAVLADFGIARALEGSPSTTGVNMTIGTPHYVSPEQAQGRTLDGRSDLYALGITLYRAATGELPFRSTDWFELARMHVEDSPPSLRVRRPDLSAGMERIILTCLEKHPDDRYGSALELSRELENLGKGF
jgi:serine/threonine protein kinase